MIETCRLKNVVIFLQTIDVQYSQKAVFNFEKDRNHQSHSSSGALHMVKKSSPSYKISSFPWETKNKSLVRLMRRLMQTNVTNIVANSYPSLSTYSTRYYFLDKHK